MDSLKIKYGVIHCHSDNSIKDSALMVEDLVKKAKELGAPAITLTDHGNMMGIYKFMDKCKENGIKGVPGVEGYYRKENKGKREHIILLAKNYQGLIAIGRVVTESYANMDKEFPIISPENLEKNIGPGSEGYGNVIITSACIGGILASVILRNDNIEESISKLEDSISTLKSPKDASYRRNLEILESIKKDLNELTERKKYLTAVSKRSQKKKIKAAESAKKKNDLDAYIILKEEIDKEKEEIDNAIKEIPKVQEKISKLSIQKKNLTERCQEDEKVHAKRKLVEDRIYALRSEKRSEKDLYKEALQKAQYFENLVGKGNFYIELQYHRIGLEAKAMPILVKIAKELNIPVVAANDIHIYDNSKESLKALQLMRSLRYNKWVELNDADAELYMKTDEELKNVLRETFSDKIVHEAMENIGNLFSKCEIVFPKENHYPKYVLTTNESADEVLRRLAYEGITRKFPNPEDFTDVYQKRLEYELDVITKMGYSDYHLIDQDFLNFGRKLGHLSEESLSYIWENIENWNLDQFVQYVETHMTEPGYSIGPGRGSAAGSLVCYLLGITSIDPIRYGLLFERFLNVERVSMPDIDSDFSPKVRDLVIEYVKKKYGRDSVCCIMTRGTQKAKASIRNAARVLGDRDGKDYLALSDTMAKMIPNEPKITLKDCYEELEETYKKDKVAMEILNSSLLIENRLQSIGMHAAGVIISDGKPIYDYIPLMWDNKYKRWKSQCDMIKAEELHLLKMDFLGLNNLSIITDALRLIKKNKGIEIDIETIPFEKAVFKDIFSAGFTNAVFQFESGGMKDMLKRFQPNSIDDIILLVAAYRPGPMQYLDDIIKVKRGEKEVKYICPALKDILGDTYGSIIYQEQVQKIFQVLAGYSLGQADLVRRAMSKKKLSVLEKEKKAFIEGDPERKITGCIAYGIPREDAENLFEEMLEFAKYAFNKSHAAAYAMVSYQTAWLKYHYSIEYMCAVMSNVDIKKIPPLINDCKQLGIEVLPPSINEANILFKIKGNSIVFGLNSVKGVGDAARSIVKEVETNGKFNSFVDYIKRYHNDKRVTSPLIESGALDIFSTSRKGMEEALDTMGTCKTKIINKTKLLETRKEELEKLINAGYDANSKEMKVAMRNVKNAESAKNLAEDQFSKITIEYSSESLFERLKKEKDKLGVYVSGHPLDEYSEADSFGCVEISDLIAANKIRVFGMITNFKQLKTKKSQAKMCAFTIEDKTGTIEAVVFPNEYKKIADSLNEDAVLIFNGDCKEETVFNSGDEEKRELKFYVSSIERAEPDYRKLSIEVNGMDEWLEVLKDLDVYKASDGYELYVFDKFLGEFRHTDFFVSPDIQYNKRGWRIKPMDTKVG